MLYVLVAAASMTILCAGQNSTDAVTSPGTDPPTQPVPSDTSAITSNQPTTLIRTTGVATPAPSCVRTNGVLVCQPDLPTTLPPELPLRPSVPTGWIAGFAIACVLVVVLAVALHFATEKIRRFRREMSRALRLIQGAPARRNSKADNRSAYVMPTGGERGGCLAGGEEDDSELQSYAAPIPAAQDEQAAVHEDAEHFHDAERFLARSVSPEDLEAPLLPSKADRLAQFHALHSIDPELEKLMPVSQIERIPRDIFAGPNPHTEYD